jgi:hypothetical protein
VNEYGDVAVGMFVFDVDPVDGVAVRSSSH